MNQESLHPEHPHNQLEVMSMFLEAQARSNLSWYKKNKNLFELVGLSENEAILKKDHINNILDDIEKFYSKIRLCIFRFFLITLGLTLIHVIFVRDYVSLVRLNTQLWGFCGSILTTWGYLFNAEISKPTKTRTVTPNPRSTNAHFQDKCVEAIQAIWNDINEREQSRQEVESKRKIALIPGFTLIALSFLCQAPLNFLPLSAALFFSFLLVFLGALCFIAFIYIDIVQLLNFIAGLVINSKRT
jgi:hypothetical protein